MTLILAIAAGVALVTGLATWRVARWAASADVAEAHAERDRVSHDLDAQRADGERLASIITDLGGQVSRADQRVAELEAERDRLRVELRARESVADRSDRLGGAT